MWRSLIEFSSFRTLCLTTSTKDAKSSSLRLSVRAIRNCHLTAIVILPADKGNAVVVMNRHDYVDKIQAMLDDTNTYKNITDKRRNPTSRTEQDLNRLLMDLSLKRSPYDEEKSQLPPPLYRYLHSTDARAATFYGLPKIHKPGNPLRPITSSIGSPTYCLSKHMVTLLSPLLKNTYTVKNSLDFKERISKLSVSEDEISHGLILSGFSFYVHTHRVSCTCCQGKT